MITGTYNTDFPQGTKYNETLYKILNTTYNKWKSQGF